MTIIENRWVRFFRKYGPIPTNENMFDEKIQRAIVKHDVTPIKLPAQFLNALLENLRSTSPRSEVLTGTAGDGKTYHCREVWMALGGSAQEWNKGKKINTLPLGDRELVIVKDLSELKQESADLLVDMAQAVTDAVSQRLYLIAANHGQLLEKLREAPQTPAVRNMSHAIEAMLVTGESPDQKLYLNLKDLSRAPASEMLADVVRALTEHEGWNECDGCPARDGSGICPIWENRSRLRISDNEHRFHKRLTALIEISEQNGVHFPVRQILELVSNILLGHPQARDGLMSCSEVEKITADGAIGLASVYRNVFGENLKSSRAEKTKPFRKLAAFGIGGETNHRIDSLLVYGADDPDLESLYREFVLSDPIYGGTRTYAQGQKAYLEGYESGARAAFLFMLRAQRQRLFFTLPESYEDKFELWDLTVFRYAGMYLKMVENLQQGKRPTNNVMSLIVRGLNRIFTGMLVQNNDELLLATSGSHAQSKTSPLLDESISVPRHGSEEVRFVRSSRSGIVLSIQLSKGGDPGLIQLALTPIRFEFLVRVAEGALPSSFSVECHEDMLAFKAKLLTGTARRRKLQDDTPATGNELILRFIDLASDGRAAPRRITVMG